MITPPDKPGLIKKADALYRFPSALFGVFAGAFIVVAGGHGIGFLWMFFYHPLGVPVITIPATIGAAGVLTVPLWSYPEKVLRVASVIVLLTVGIAFAISEVKLITLVSALPCLGIWIWHFKMRNPIGPQAKAIATDVDPHSTNSLPPQV